MTRPLLLILSLGLLAGCGADGAPRPPPDSTETGVTISGEAFIGVATTP